LNTLSSRVVEAAALLVAVVVEQADLELAPDCR
jgi:hypothetical protein